MLEKIDRLLEQGRYVEATSLIAEAVRQEVDTKGRHVTYANALLLGGAWREVSALLPPYTNFFLTSGWLHSLASGTPVNGENEAVPWFTYPAIDFLDSIVQKEWKIFEWGSGNSTIWWGSKAGEVTAVEDNEQWFEHVKSRGTRNATVHLRGDESSYVGEIDQFDDGYFDVIVIDGAYRNACAAACAKKLADTGIIVFDNSDWREFEDGVQSLSEHGFSRIDFWGLIPSYAYKNCTSVFLKDFGILSGLAPPARHESSVGISCAQAIKK